MKNYGFSLIGGNYATSGRQIDIGLTIVTLFVNKDTSMFTLLTLLIQICCELPLTYDVI